MDYDGLRMHRAVGCWPVVRGESDPRGSSPTACLGSAANVRAWESRIWRASALASNKLCHSLSLLHLYRSSYGARMEAQMWES